MISAIVYYTHKAITTVTANMISLANEPTPYPIAPPKNEIPLLVAFLFQWSYHKKLPKQCTKSTKVYADKAQKIKSANHCTYRQINDVMFYYLSSFFK